MRLFVPLFLGLLDISFFIGLNSISKVMLYTSGNYLLKLANIQSNEKFKSLLQPST